MVRRVIKSYANQVRDVFLTMVKSRPELEEQQPEGEGSPQSGAVASNTSHLKDDFPFDQIMLLVQRRQELQTATSLSSCFFRYSGEDDNITTTGNVATTPTAKREDSSVLIEQPLPPTINILPNTCGIIRNLRIIGIFPTSCWLSDPTMPEDIRELFGGTPFFALGHYRCLAFDMRDGKGIVHPIIMVINSGVKGMQLGVWGCAFLARDEYVFENGMCAPTCIARFEATITSSEDDDDEDHSSLQTVIFQQISQQVSASSPPTPVSSVQSLMTSAKFAEYPTTDDSSFYIEFTEEPITLPGGNIIFATTQLEKILGTVIGFVFTSIDWSENALPEKLIGLFDKSPKSERKRTRILQHTPILDRKKWNMNMSKKKLNDDDDDETAKTTPATTTTATPSPSSSLSSISESSSPPSVRQLSYDL